MTICALLKYTGRLWTSEKEISRHPDRQMDDMDSCCFFATSGQAKILTAKSTQILWAGLNFLI